MSHSRLGMLLPEKYESILDVSSKGPSSGKRIFTKSLPTLAAVVHNFNNGIKIIDIEPTTDGKIGLENDSLC